MKLPARLLMAASAQAAPARSCAGAGRMSAWRVHAYGGLPELRLETARLPALRAPDHVLIKVHASSINPLDVAMLNGYGSRLLNVLRRVESVAESGEGAGTGEVLELPLTPGREAAGVVVAAGPGARATRGQRVWAVVAPHWRGAHAQYVLVKDDWVSPVPSTLSELQAGGVLYAGLSACALLRAAGLRGPRGRSQRPVLLLGLGGVGHLAIQLLVHFGYQVIVGCSADLLPTARALGAVDALDRRASDYSRQLVDAGPYEAILDCAGLGGGEAGARSWQFGRYVTLTSPLLRETDAKGVVLGALSAGSSLARHSLAALPGSPATSGCPPPHVRWAFFSPRRDDILLLKKLAECGELTVCVEATLPWRCAAQGYERAAGGAARGKLLLDFTDDTE